MSFLFPANPADGDVVVQPQPDGTLIKGTYNSTTNTWAVGELPQEPGIPGPTGPQGAQGDQGIPGKGLSISGLVDTFSLLPTAADHALQFWIVDDTNTVYYSNGVSWFDQGGPVVGPKGDDGTDGTDGTDGLRGSDGLGWTSTTIIDETTQNPPNYQVRFNSDDGLGFVTDNLMGPQGEPGIIPVATATSIGGIKIGRGLNIRPDGVVNAGETAVDLETVPLSAEGSDSAYVLNFVPQYSTFNNNQYTSSQAINGRADDREVYTDQTTILLPSSANGASITWFQNTNMNNNPAKPLPASQVQTYMGLYQISLDIEESDINYTTSNMAVNHFHNTAANAGTQSISERLSAILTTKTNEIVFPEGTASVTFTRRMRLYRAAYVQTVLGIGRLQVTPFRKDAFNDTITLFSGQAIVGDPEYLPPSTPDEILRSEGDRLRFINRQAVMEATTILSYPEYFTEQEIQQIKDDVSVLISARDLPGSPSEIEAVIEPIVARINSFIAFRYRFEPINN